MGLYNERGIYEIVNLANNKFYIGYASISFGDRRDSHFACLRNGYHFNKYRETEGIYRPLNYWWQFKVI